SLNLMSAFGFILVLGIVVDDAIVTGENVYTHLRSKDSGLQAAIHGTREVAIPVTFGVLTTIAAFVPLGLIDGMLGRFFAPIPAVVIPVLLISLIESKFVLPAHLKHVNVNNNHESNGFSAWQSRFAQKFEDWIVKYYKPVLQLALRNRYVTLATFTGVLLVMAALLLGGWMRWTFFPTVESETATASLEMPVGTPFEVTDKHIQRIVDAAVALQERYTDPDSGKSMITNILSSTGASRGTGGTHVGRVQFETAPRQERTIDFTITQLNNEWRDLVGLVPGAEALRFRASWFRPGEPIDIQFSGNSLDELSSIGDEVKQRLATYPGVFEISDSLSDGKEELRVELTPQGHVLGLTRNDIVGQVGQAFKGLQAQRIQRGRDDIRVLIRYPIDERRTISALNEMLIAAPNGRLVPLSTVATLRPGRGPSQITRIDHYRVLNVTADVDKEEVNMTVLQSDLRTFIDSLIIKYPSIRYTMEGEQSEQRKSFASLFTGLIVVLGVIYCLLALPLKSYVQPLVVMSIIPFGVIGAIIGHWLMGYSLSILSLLGFLALVGVVVNDSLVLVDFANQHKRAGEPIESAVERAGVVRFRPVMLTSLTTFMALLPLLLERSTTAQYLIPMAISLGFGILFATFITLILVPTNLLIANDLGERARGAMGLPAAADAHTST
ncbi:MAG: efflux RND transporter permease subunit, partial [Gammaproteobacteria bacterium]|nr:efflux RND transporter permease subunit [Gammaproteobacteria bacterium]